MPKGLLQGTHLALYADDTKIWRTIYNEADQFILDKDIDYLNCWVNENKMKFHTGKCKVLSVTHSPPPLLGILPCIQFMYSLAGSILD